MSGQISGEEGIQNFRGGGFPPPGYMPRINTGFESLRLESQLKTPRSETYKKTDVFIRDLLQMINKFAALLLIVNAL